MRLDYPPHGIRPARLPDILIPKGSRFLVPAPHLVTGHQETKVIQLTVSDDQTFLMSQFCLALLNFHLNGWFI